MGNDLSEQSAVVTGLTWYGADLFELTLTREGLDFTPGECVALFSEDREVSRPYSIASGIHEPVLRFLIRSVPDGTISGYLANRRPGDCVRLSRPFGWFHPGQNGQGVPVAFVATGTGIAPFLSYLRSDPVQTPAQCLYGVRQLNDAVGLRCLEDHCHVGLAVSRQRVPDTFHGRVSGLLESLTVTPESHFYLCGLDAMIHTVGDWLETRGVDPFSIHREVFFNASQ